MNGIPKKYILQEVRKLSSDVNTWYICLAFNSLPFSYQLTFQASKQSMNTVKSFNTFSRLEKEKSQIDTNFPNAQRNKIYNKRKNIIVGFPRNLNQGK